MNMDYSLCNALAYNTKDAATGVALLQALIVYDVACQFFKKFEQRWKASAFLQAIYGWFILSFIWAVGKFHLGAHIALCYPNFSLNHKTGAGQVDGETMETLWALLNAISIMARAMTKAHRQETEDLAINHIAWKGTVSSSRCLYDFQQHVMTQTSFSKVTRARRSF